MFEEDLLSERARVTPDKLALVSVASGERLTYAQLNARASQAAAAIQKQGVNPGDRYGILGHNSIDFIAFFFAAAKTGAIVVPLSTRATAHELEGIVRDCGMTALFADDDFANVARDLPGAVHPLTVIPSWLTAPPPMKMEMTHPSSAFGTFSPLAGRRPLEGKSASRPFSPPRGEKVPKADEGCVIPSEVEGPGRWGAATAEDTYCLLYTSGTTGKPKGVMIPRRQLLWNGYNTAINWGLREDDVSPIFTPMYHAGGLAAFLIPILSIGGTVVIHRTFDVAEVWRVIEGERCTVVLGVPTIWKLLMEAPEFATVDLTSVRWLISGGAPLPAYIIEAYQKRGVAFKQGYGMTEVGVNCFTMTVEESFRKPGSIGRPMMFTRIKLADADGNEVPTGEVGEMYIAGPHVSSGYWNNPAATAESYLPGGWFRTGDLARRDDEGFFYIAGRRKEMFISGGVNVYPAEIEAELVLHPAVSDAAVVAVSDETWGEAGVAFVVAKNLSAEDLTAYLAARIARYKVPKRFIFIDFLPRTPYGKVEKAKLRERLS